MRNIDYDLVKHRTRSNGRWLLANTLTWQQVNTWRLAQHELAPRWTRQDIVKIATRTGDIQAQVPSAAELAVWARTEGLERADVQNALWQDHTLIKTWAMRGTLHLLAADSCGLYTAVHKIQARSQ